MSGLPSWIIQRIRAGRVFEMTERQEWAPDKCSSPGRIQFEAPSIKAARRGRIDVRLEWRGLVVLLELKATNWDKIKSHRVRANVLRHICQLYRYVDGELEQGTEGICHAIVYQRAPLDRDRRRSIEGIFAEQCVQLVWRNE